MLPWPILYISSRVLAPLAAARLLPVWRRSWKWNPAGNPASTTILLQCTDRWKLLRLSDAPSGPERPAHCVQLGTQPDGPSLRPRSSPAAQQRARRRSTSVDPSLGVRLVARRTS